MVIDAQFLFHSMDMPQEVASVWCIAGDGTGLRACGMERCEVAFAGGHFSH